MVEGWALLSGMARSLSLVPDIGITCGHSAISTLPASTESRLGVFCPNFSGGISSSNKLEFLLAPESICAVTAASEAF